MLEVRDLNEDMAISAMKRGLRGSRFMYSLDKILPRTYAELLERAYKYVHADEGASDRRLTERKVGLLPSQAGPRPTNRSHPSDGARDRLDGEVRDRCIPSTTPILPFLLLVCRF